MTMTSLDCTKPFQRACATLPPEQQQVAFQLGLHGSVRGVDGCFCQACNDDDEDGPPTQPLPPDEVPPEDIPF